MGNAKRENQMIYIFVYIYILALRRRGASHSLHFHKRNASLFLNDPLYNTMDNKLHLVLSPAQLVSTAVRSSHVRFGLVVNSASYLPC